MGMYKDIAEPLIARGIPTIPLKPKSKIAFTKEWQNIATLDPKQVEIWDAQYPEANGACVAKAAPGGVWFFEVDYPDAPRIIQEATGQELPKTFRVRSSPGKGHYYFRQTPASIALGNVKIKCADMGVIVPDDETKEFLSARVDNAYVVAPGSIHPKTGVPYEVVLDHEVVEAPQWLIDWLKIYKDAGQQKSRSEINSTERIPRGAHDTTLTSIAGKLRHDGLEQDALEAALIEICEKRCDGYGSDYRDMCAKIAKSVCRYPVGADTTAYVGSTLVQAQPEIVPEGEELEEQPTFTVASYPKFPSWIMNGTSLYEGFAKPYCAINSRIPEFMWLPAFALLMNYCGTKVRIHMKSLIPSLFMVIIGKRGETVKSSSVESAIEYFHKMGLCENGSPSIKNAEGRILVWSAGSAEGLGLDMQRTNCKNVLLYYDELSVLVTKTGVEGSSLNAALLKLYESANFSNKIKGVKESYTVDQGSYCASFIACSTDKNFLPNWAKMQGASTGLDDRFFFLYQPEQLPQLVPQTTVDVQIGQQTTKLLIDKAVAQGTYKIVDESPLAHQMQTKAVDNRESIRVEKFALGFAIDLGKDEIDEECIERSLALIAYEKQVKRFLAPFEARTREGAVQMELLTFLMKSRGTATMREVNGHIHPERMGTSMWEKCLCGLVKAGYIEIRGKGYKSDPIKVVLMRAPEKDDE